MSARLALIAALPLALIGASAYAAPILSVQSGVFLYDLGPSGTYDVKDAVSNSGPSLDRAFDSVFAYADGSMPGGHISGTYHAEASAQFGVLHGSIASVQTGTENPGRSVPLISTFTSASFEDTITITYAGPLNPTFFRMAFAIHGTGRGTNSPTSEGVHSSTWGGFAAGAAGANQTVWYLDTTNHGTVVNPMYSDAVNFVTGVPVSISASLGPALSISCTTGLVGHPCVDWTGSAMSNFGSTAIMTGIEVYDAAGVRIDDFSITSESGTAYTSHGVVPEPSTLFLVGLGGLLAYRKRTRLGQSARDK